MTKRNRKRSDLERAAARLDDHELDRAFEAALRGDMDQVKRIMSRTASVSGDVRTVSALPWRDSSSWLFGRSAFDRTKRRG